MEEGIRDKSLEIIAALLAYFYLHCRNITPNRRSLQIRQQQEYAGITYLKAFPYRRRCTLSDIGGIRRVRGL